MSINCALRIACSRAHVLQARLAGRCLLNACVWEWPAFANVKGVVQS